MHTHTHAHTHAHKRTVYVHVRAAVAVRLGSCDVGVGASVRSGLVQLELGQHQRGYYLFGRPLIVIQCLLTHNVS